MAAKKPPENDYERIGKLFTEIAQAGFVSKKRLYSVSFARGFASGLGGVIGATVGVALLLYILSLFDSVPLVGAFFDNLRSTIENR